MSQEPEPPECRPSLGRVCELATYTRGQRWPRVKQKLAYLDAAERNDLQLALAGRRVAPEPFLDLGLGLCPEHGEIVLKELGFERRNGLEVLQ
jgi:hypothetical protein